LATKEKNAMTITREIDCTIYAIFAGEDKPSELIRHHWEYFISNNPDNGIFNSADRLLNDTDNRAELMANAILGTTMSVSDQQDMRYGENSFFEYDPAETQRNITNRKIDDLDEINHIICDHYLGAHQTVFNCYPTQIETGDPWVCAFGLGTNCDCCGILLNALNKSNAFSLCEECDNNLERQLYENAFEL
jgi:hypothetical protein